MTLGVVASAHVEAGAAPSTPPTYIQSTTNVATAIRTVSWTFSAGVQTSDLIYIYITHTTSPLPVFSAAGWVNPLGGSTYVNATTTSSCAIYHLVTSGENGQTAFTLTNLFASNISGNVLAITLRNVNQTTPVDGTGTALSATSVTPHTLAGITGTGGVLSADSLVVCAAHKDTGTAPYATPPAGYTVRQVSGAGVATPSWIGTRDALTTANTDVPAVNITPSASDEYYAISVAFAASSAAVTYDTFTAVASTYGGSSNEGGTAVTLGMSNWQRINSGQTLTVHGVRYWRTTQSQSSAPTVGMAIMGAAALRTKASTVGAGSVAAGWEQVLFDTPYTLNTNDNFVAWVNLPSGGYPANTSPFSDGQDSQLGLYQISGTAAPGVFVYTTNPATPPTGGAGSVFWVEPLVTLV